jgi:hypothetical protein
MLIEGKAVVNPGRTTKGTRVLEHYLRGQWCHLPLPARCYVLVVSLPDRGIRNDCGTATSTNACVSCEDWCIRMVERELVLLAIFAFKEGTYFFQRCLGQGLLSPSWLAAHAECHRVVYNIGTSLSETLPVTCRATLSPNN